MLETIRLQQNRKKPPLKSDGNFLFGSPNKVKGTNDGAFRKSGERVRKSYSTQKENRAREWSLGKLENEKPSELPRRVFQ